MYKSLDCIDVVIDQIGCLEMVAVMNKATLDSSGMQVKALSDIIAVFL